MKHHSSLLRLLGALSIPVLLFACNNNDNDEAREAVQALVAECVDPGAVVPPGGWICGEDNIVECNTWNGATVDTIYAQLVDGACASTTLSVSDPGPFELGTHVITVSAAAQVVVESEPLCTSTLTVIDTTAPVVTPKTTELWPPNHKFHTVTIDDCVEVLDACDPDVVVTFTSAASDEPRNDTGDGNTEVDIQNLGCGSVELLAERKGNGDARVYTLGFRAVDLSGNVTEGACHVVVPHDQGGAVPVDSGIAYQEDAPACD